MKTEQFKWDDANRIKQTLDWLMEKRHRYNDLKQGKKYISALESLNKQFTEKGYLSDKQKSYVEVLYELYFKALGFEYCQSIFKGKKTLRY